MGLFRETLDEVKDAKQTLKVQIVSNNLDIININKIWRPGVDFLFIGI
jgi:hypothetical protein